MILWSASDRGRWVTKQHVGRFPAATKLLSPLALRADLAVTYRTWRFQRPLQSDRDMNPVSAVTSELVTIGDIRAAADTLRSVAVRTPLLRASALSDDIGASILLKPEMLQRGGAFKFRGAYSLISGLTPAERARGVVAPSSGNHAQA